ncbi:response regulator [Paenibacillus rigui]|uniref:DNA-binding response regulator n=1 Tax=Paenibacillus rigui TaxID=554312 RepID=A0A229UHC5_9BACL|nr:response regulator [Paenibacillus rigui]OXM82797.1 DNA-binding response regulator [Paenibacillus rigui]
MRIIIIDDEKAMHLIMKKMLSKISSVEIVGLFRDTEAAASFMNDHVVDMAFVDISMPNESGLLFAKRMAETGRNLQIAFVTSHKEYAMEAFDIYAIDYIVKPVTLERLERTVNRAMAIHQFAVLAETGRNRDTVSIFCMGGLEVRNGQRLHVKWRSQKSAELFAYLLLNRGRMVAKARITDDIFAGMAAKNAENYLHTTVYQMRKSLESYGIELKIESDHGSYGMDITGAYIDFVELEEKMKRFGVIDRSNLNEAKEAEELYVGDLFGDKAFFWALSDIERLSAMYTAFVKKLAEALLKNNENELAVRLLLKLLNRDGLDEETVSMLLAALTAQKNRTAVAEQYMRYVKLLRHELGIGPSKRLANQYERLLSELD